MVERTWRRRRSPAPQREEKPAISDEAPDWLKGLGGAQAEEPARPAEVEEEAAAQPANLPDWLKAAEPKMEQPPAEGLGTSAQEQDDAIAWLESLAAKHGAKPEELVTDPGKRTETPPEWVQQVQGVSPVQAESLGASAQEQDDAIAWLESLAAKHGAKPEELVTDPSKRTETPPDWVPAGSIHRRDSRLPARRRRNGHVAEQPRRRREAQTACIR
ncbi:MAG: hypothetical protein HND47_18800 [Chloroflexi bacterium]|nr:hypothetical protein [Chloroflexota bacterium]